MLLPLPSPYAARGDGRGAFCRSTGFAFSLELLPVGLNSLAASWAQGTAAGSPLSFLGTGRPASPMNVRGWETELNLSRGGWACVGLRRPELPARQPGERWCLPGGLRGVIPNMQPYIPLARLQDCHVLCSRYAVRGSSGVDMLRHGGALG